MISSIRLIDFKGHRDTTVELGRLTVLVGPNGSGKTSVLEALWLQSELVLRGTGILQGDWSLADLKRRGAGGSIHLESQGFHKGKSWKLHVDIPEEMTWEEEGAPQHKIPGHQSMPARSKTVGVASLYKLNAQQIAKASYSDQPGAPVERDGANTAVALAALKLGYDEAFERVEADMRRLIPNIERVRIRPATASRPNPVSPLQQVSVLGHKVFFDFRGAPGVPAHAASEGTLIVLALLTVLHSPNRPNVVLLDDFCQSLHPQAQMELVRLIKGLLDEVPDVQIVATTHSPYVLDEVDPSDVRVFALREDGTSAVKSLSEHPQASAMKGSLTPGQLWALDPEQEWVISEKTT